MSFDKAQPMKKVLLSAFGCAPNTGSDAEVAWRWATGLAGKGYPVWVLTREVYREQIEQQLQHDPYDGRLQFIYYDIPGFLRVTTWWKSRNYFYYYLWQWGACKKARAEHAEVCFDLVHHVTWVSVRQPSFLGRLGIPFIFGPVAGGEKAPWRLRSGYSIRQWISDITRDFANLLVRIDPLVRRTLREADRIYVTSPQTQQLLPRKVRDRSAVKLAIGAVDAEESQQPATAQTGSPVDDAFRVLYVGRFIGWKGMHLGLRAFRDLQRRVPEARLTMVGRGRDEGAWKALAASLGIADKVTWIPWLEQQQLAAVYRQQHCFLFPSLHDSGGMVVLEALGHGLPVVCLNLGGPGVIVDESCGHRIGVEGRSRAQVITALSGALHAVARDPELRQQLSQGAVSRVEQFRWSALIDSIYD